MSGVQVSVQRGSNVLDAPGDQFVRDWISRTLQALPGAAGGKREVAVRFVDEAEGRHLNKQYRNRDTATNVLSFPAAPDSEFAALDSSLPMPLGDLVLCTPVLAREAASQARDRLDHCAHLLVHGTLHLLGYEHDEDADAEVMEALEVSILAAHGIDNPYRERDSA